MVAKLQARFGHLIHVLDGVGVYATLALLLPGGSIVALLLWLYRHRTTLEPRRLVSSLAQQGHRFARSLRAAPAQLRSPAQPRPCASRRRTAVNPPHALPAATCHAKS
jgi:hypothetical protein